MPRAAPRGGRYGYLRVETWGVWPAEPDRMDMHLRGQLMHSPPNHKPHLNPTRAIDWHTDSTRARGIDCSKKQCASATQDAATGLHWIGCCSKWSIDERRSRRRRRRSSRRGEARGEQVTHKRRTHKQHISNFRNRTGQEQDWHSVARLTLQLRVLNQSITLFTTRWTKTVRVLTYRCTSTVVAVQHVQYSYSKYIYAYWSRRGARLYIITCLSQTYTHTPNYRVSEQFDSATLISRAGKIWTPQWSKVREVLEQRR